MERETAHARRAPREGEWTRAKMAVFLRELAASQSVAQACRAVGMSRQSAYKLRYRLAGTPFALGWDVALESGLEKLAHAVMDRAVNGVEVPHYYHGELIGTSRQYDERLAVWLLANPWKVGRRQMAREYAAPGFDKLLGRIVDGPLEWNPGEQLPGRHTPVRSRKEGERLQSRFFAESFYAQLASEAVRRR